MLNLLTATGTLSKTFGPYAYNNTLEPGYQFGAQTLQNGLFDGLIREFKIPVSDSDYLKINETMRGVMIEPFAAGINYYLYTHWDTLPSWIKENTPVKATDIASIGALVSLAFSSQVLSDWMTADTQIKQMGVTQYLDTYQNQSGPHTLSAETLGVSNMGSNEWTVNNTLSATGFPMIGTNPHLDWDGLTQWHMAHLMAPAQGTLPPLNIYGVIFYGLPFIGIGHNDYISWMSTVNQPDLGDIWIEQLSTDNTMYKYQGMWLPLIQETVNLPVKVPGIGIIVNIPITAYYTRHGPLLTFNTTDHWALAVNYSSNQNSIGFRQFYLMDTAQNVTQFKNALSLLGVPMFNYMVATVYNETFYVWNAICPVRNDIYDWTHAVPGWESSTDWGGPIPFVSLPQQKDPAQGWMQNCNIPCWNITTQPNAITTANSTIPFPRYLVDWYNYTSGTYVGMSNHTRGYNLFQILNEATSVNFTDMLGIIGNASVPYLAADYINMLPANVPGVGNETLNNTVVLLKNWDRHATNQTAMTVFELWVDQFTTGVPISQDNALTTLNNTVNFMVSKYNSSTGVYWGNVHIVVRGNHTVGLNGTVGEPYGCLNPHYGRFDSTTGNWYCYGGSSFMMVTNLQLNNVTSWSCLPYGDSNNPNSPHFADMLINYYSKDILHPDFFIANDIQNTSNQDPTQGNYTIPVHTLGETISMINQLLLLQLIPSLLVFAQIYFAQQATTHLIVLGTGAIILVAVVAVAVIASRRP